MPTFRRTAAAVVPCILALGLGFSLGWSTAPYHETIQAEGRKAEAITAPKVRLDHVQASSSVGKEKVASPKDTRQQVVLQLLAETDPAKRSRSLASWFNDATSNEIHGVLQKLQTVSQENGSLDFFGEVIMAWAQHDLESATAFALSLPTGDHQATALFAVAAEQAAKDLQEALRWAETILPAGGMRNAAIKGILDAWATREPSEAIQYAEKISSLKTRVEGLQTIFSRWAQTDPSAAANHLASLAPGSTRSTLTRVVAMEWGRRDLSAALKWADSLPEGQRRDGAIYKIIDECTGNTPAAVAEYVQHLPAGILRGNAWSIATQQWAEVDPKAALTWAVTVPLECWENDHRYRPLAGAIGRWMEADPESATRWAATLENDADGEHLLSTPLQYWLSVDSRRAISWLQSLPPGRSRDFAVAALGSRLAWHNPGEHPFWLDTISDESLKKEIAVQADRKRVKHGAFFQLE